MYFRFNCMLILYVLLLCVTFVSQSHDMAALTSPTRIVLVLYVFLVDIPITVSLIELPLVLFINWGCTRVPQISAIHSDDDARNG